MKNQVNGVIVACLVLLAGCATKRDDQSTQTNTYSVYISAGDKNGHLIELSQDAEKPTGLTLSTNGFQIVGSPHLDDKIAIQVCASNNDESMGSIKIRHKTGEARCFHVGSGMAVPPTELPNNYVPLIVSDGNAHNYYSVERRVSNQTNTLVNINSVMALP